MGDGNGEPAMQVIVLGSGGGPLELNTTAFLVRSLASGWRKGCLLAVDAGIHLSGIQSIIETTQGTFPGGPRKLDNGSTPTLPQTIKSGAFAGVSLPFIDSKANAGHILKQMVDTFLITHPHLDHISGLVVNTAALPGTRSKRIAALPTTIHAFKQHIFNNVIWPNLSDENDGAGLITYMRLVEGGAPALGFGYGREADSLGPAGPDGAKGYVEIAEGLSVKAWNISHGHCMENHWHRGSNVGLQGLTPGPPDTSPLILNEPHFQDARSQRLPSGVASPYRRQGSMAFPGLGSSAGGKGYQSPMPYFPSHQPSGEKECVYDSSAYFIRDIGTGREVLIFGDVEPDSLSLSPRNHRVWEDAAPKVAAGTLKAIFIECSYDERQSDDTLFGHLCPRFLMEELQALARQVVFARQTRAIEKRQREMSRGRSDEHKRKRVFGSMVGTPVCTPTDATFKHSRRSRDTSPLGLEVKLEGDGYVDHLPTRRDFVSQASGSIDTSEPSVTSSPEEPRDSVTTLLMESATRRKEIKREGARLHRQSSSVSPHSRPMRHRESMNGMNMEVFELDEHAPGRARIMSGGHRPHSASGHRPQRPHSGPNTLPSSATRFGEWSVNANSTRQERVSKDSITEENEGSGEATPTVGRSLKSANSSRTSIPKPTTGEKEHADAVPLELRQYQERSGNTHVGPHQTLPHSSIGASHEPSSGNLSPSKDSDGTLTPGVVPGVFSASPAPTSSIDTARANRTSSIRGGDNQHGDDGARSPIIEAIKGSVLDHSDYKNQDRIPSTVGMLRELKVIVIHVKERLDDEEPAGDRILRELKEFEREEGLGVEFILSERGLSVWV